jgi:hypothetical protein
MGLFRDLTGQRFGCLTVVRRGPNSASGRSRWVCRCDCGVPEALKHANNLHRGLGLHCGCKTGVNISAGKIKHGYAMLKRDGSRHSEYLSWGAMKSRVLNPNDHAYPRYGGRGIGICEEWQSSFEAFLRDMGAKPGPGYSLERRDNNGDYCPANCCWATVPEQLDNRRITVTLEHDGVVKPLAEWARISGVSRNRLAARLRAGWPVDRALSAPRGAPASHGA